MDAACSTLLFVLIRSLVTPRPPASIWFPYLSSLVPRPLHSVIEIIRREICFLYSPFYMQACWCPLTSGAKQRIFREAFGLGVLEDDGYPKVESAHTPYSTNTCRSSFLLAFLRERFRFPSCSIIFLAENDTQFMNTEEVMIR